MADRNRRRYFYVSYQFVAANMTVGTAGSTIDFVGPLDSDAITKIRKKCAELVGANVAETAIIGITPLEQEEN